MPLVLASLKKQPHPRASTRLNVPRADLLATTTVVAGIGLYAAAMLATSGAAGPLHHLPYPVLLVAGYLWGLRGALLVALLPATISGLYPFISGVDESQTAWLRGIGFVMVAAVSGILADRLRAAVDGWRSTAVAVKRRERESLIALANAAEARDEITGEHAQRVEHSSERLALAAGMSVEEAAEIGRASLLHDIGKLRVPDSVLLKAGPLSPEEMSVIRDHTLWGEGILARGEAFALARRVARWHHENFDGSGYPDGLRADSIPLEARIVRIADAFDAMTNDRPYQEACSIEQALDELRTGAGRMFDPELVTLFLELVRSAHGVMIHSGLRPIFTIPAGRDARLLAGR